jgi:hypothetical protein
MNSYIRIGLVAVLLLSVLLVAGWYALFHGYFDHGLLKIKQVEWSSVTPRRVAVVAERSDHEAMSSNVYFVLVGDHVFSATELRHAYHSDYVIFAAASNCLSVSWRDFHHLVLNCRNGTIDSPHINAASPEPTILK